MRGIRRDRTNVRFATPLPSANRSSFGLSGASEALISIYCGLANSNIAKPIGRAATLCRCKPSYASSSILRALSSSVINTVGLRSFIAPASASVFSGPPDVNIRIGALRSVSMLTDMTRSLIG